MKESVLFQEDGHIFLEKLDLKYEDQQLQHRRVNERFLHTFLLHQNRYRHQQEQVNQKKLIHL